LDKARADDLVYAASLMETLPEYETVTVEDFSVPGNNHKMTVRLFTPRSLPDPAPAWVYIHGVGL
jgi:acetyl esterase/lipase